jgi:hypothetical protein
MSGFETALDGALDDVHGSVMFLDCLVPHDTGDGTPRENVHAIERARGAIMREWRAIGRVLERSRDLSDAQRELDQAGRRAAEEAEGKATT